MTKSINYVTTTLGNNLGQFSIAAQWVGEFVREQGYLFNHIELENSQSFTNFIKAIHQFDGITFLNNWLYDARISFFPEQLSSQINIFPENANIIANIGDHPFTTFMFNRVATASRNILYNLQDSEFIKGFSDIAGFYPQQFHNTSYPLPRLTVDQLPDRMDRKLDVLVPCLVSRSTYSLPTLISTELETTLSTVESLNPYQYQCNHYTLFASHLSQTHGLDMAELKEKNNHDFYLICMRLGVSDERHRALYRVQELQKLAKYNPDIQFYVTDSKWEKIQESNVKFIQKQQFSTLLQLIANSIAVLHLHPTYFTGGHERPFISAALGTPTLTPALKWLETFGMPDFIKPYVDERQFRDIFYETKNIYSNDKTKQMIDQLHTQFGTNSYFRNIPDFWP